MKIWLILFIIGMLALLANCGGGADKLPDNYVGTFKSIHVYDSNGVFLTSDQCTVIITIKSDNGNNYSCSINCTGTNPLFTQFNRENLNGTWGATASNSFGSYSSSSNYKFTKGNDTNFIDFSFNYVISGIFDIYGVALRQ